MLISAQFGWAAIAVGARRVAKSAESRCSIIFGDLDSAQFGWTAIAVGARRVAKSAESRCSIISGDLDSAQFGETEIAGDLELAEIEAG
jgi:5'-3' exonuclease